MKYQSNAQWPPSVFDNANGDNVSTDTHDTEESAQGVCMLLERHGFGGQRKQFPVRTWVTEVEE